MSFRIVRAGAVYVCARCWCSVQRDNPEPVTAAAVIEWYVVPVSDGDAFFGLPVRRAVEIRPDGWVGQLLVDGVDVLDEANPFAEEDDLVRVCRGCATADEIVDEPVLLAALEGSAVE